MAKTTQNYSANAARNTALIAPDGTQIPLGEGQTLPKHVNDAFRALMADTAIAAKFSGLPAGRSIALTVRLVANTDSLGSFPAVGGQKLELDGAVNPALVLAGTTAAPHTYTFDTSDSSMTVALRFYEDASQTTEYTTGVTVSSGQTTIAVTDTTPGVLYYQLAGSAGLGGIAYVLGTSTGGGGGLSSVVQDTTPELGGDLDLNSSDVTGTGNINITGTITTTGSGSFANVTVTGTVDGRDVSADGAKLDSIEPGATADQTGAEIKALYEAETNAFTDAQFTKLSNINQGVATTDSVEFANIDVSGEIRVSTIDPDPDGVPSDGSNPGTLTILGNLQVDGDTTTVNSTTVEVGDKNIVLGADATADTQNHGAGITVSRPDSTDAGISWDETSDEWGVSNGLDVAGNIKVSGTVDGRDVAADGTKLDGIAAGATAFDGQYSSLTGTPTLGTAAAAATTDFATAAQGATADTAVQPNDSPTFGTVTADGLSLGDNDAATFGGGNDLQIWHDGNNSNIVEVGTGDLNINAQNLNLADGAPNYNYYFRGIAGGEARLYHNGSQKLATKSTGVDVTGNVTADGLTVDTNTLYVDATNNRVGISTTIPEQKLHVEGQVVVDGGTGVSSTGVLHVRQNGDTSGSGITITGSNAVSHRIWKSAGGALSFGPSTDPDAFTQDLSGNVGIGTTPSSPLHVYHATTDTVANFESGDTAVAVNLTASDNSMQLATSGTDGILKNNGSGNLRLFNNGSEHMRIDSSGNVGIGTSAATELLDVDHDAIRLRQSQTPASATATGQQGEICWDSNYVYVCVATNTWKRSALSTW